MDRLNDFIGEFWLEIIVLACVAYAVYFVYKNRKKFQWKKPVD